MPVLTSMNIAPIPIFNQRWPDECPKALAFDMNFNGIDEYDLNLLLSIDQGQVQGVQACYYDNMSNAAPVMLEAAGTGFRTRFEARWFGNRTLLMPDRPQMKFTCTGGNGIFRLILTNTPLMPFDQDGT